VISTEICQVARAGLLRLCMVNLDGYHLYNPDCQSIFGGAEVQSYLIARGLAGTGRFAVSAVVMDHGQPRVECRNGTCVYAHVAYRSPIRVDKSLRTSLRWWERRLAQAVTWRLQRGNTVYMGGYPVTTTRVAIYDEIDAEVYMTRCNTPRATDLAVYCSKRKKPFIFLAASDIDYRAEYWDYPELKYVIEHADLHIVQSEHQQELLQKNFERPSIVIGNMIDAGSTLPRQEEAEAILWVGKSDQVKRPEVFLELARRLPRYRFVMLMNRVDDKIFRLAQATAASLGNVTIVDYVPYAQTERYFASAKLLVNTSVFEGFPNAFLQAARYGVPVVSYQVDPAGILAERGCGLSSHGDFQCLVQNVCDLMEVPGLYAEKSSRCIEYVRRFHDPKEIIAKYEDAINSVLKKG
jgi:glycosyltransferase involved in cell wall biosynthesis